MFVLLEQIPKDQGVLTVLEYMANMVDFESAVQQCLEYFLELAKEEGGIDLNASGKRLVAVAMKNNSMDTNIQVLGCKLYNHLVVGSKFKLYEMLETSIS